VSVRAHQQPVLGILGGMGPLATADFITKMTQALPAKCDRDHIPWITLSQPGIPDRSESIQSGSDAPLPYLTSGVAWLAAQGVSQIVIPCNTSHFWYEQMQAASAVPILHIADAAVNELKKTTPPEAGPVALLATRGTVRTGIYAGRLKSAGYRVVEPDNEEQTRLDNIIHCVKAGDVAPARERMQRLEAALHGKGVKLAILGCTELPLAHDRRQPALPVIDTSLALAKEALRRLGYLESESDGE
jgi:aspartate racemase